MTFNWVDWKGIFGPIIGGVLTAFPIYFFFFRQMVATKDALIEGLREKNRNLEAERLPLVIQEKKVLVEDIEARAKEKAETDKAMEEMNGTIRKVTEDLRAHTHNIQQSLGGVTEQIKDLVEDFPQKMGLNQTAGLVMGAKLLQESYVEWRLLFTKLPSFPGTIEFDTHLRGQGELIITILKRVRSGGGLLKIEELALKPQVTEKVAEIAKANYPPGEWPASPIRDASLK